MKKDEYNLFSEEKEEEQLEKEPVKKEIIKQVKTKHTVTSISPAFIYTVYVIDGIKYGARIDREEKHKNLKPGDTILL